MRLKVKLEAEKIMVQCEIAVQAASYAFALCATLHMREIRNNGREISDFHIEDHELLFRPKMKKYQLDHIEPGILSLYYEGELDGTFLLMRKDIYHFSLYNGWYPIAFDVCEDYEITLAANADYILLNGTYDDKKNVWQYTTAWQQMLKDCNIILLHRDHVQVLENPYVKIYFFHPEQQTIAQELFFTYNSIMDFYIELYGNNKLTDTSIVFLPQGQWSKSGAYKRDRLIVFGDADANIRMSAYTLAHEMGHAWAIGAAISSWEDWLNETHAEWSALLYLSDHDPALFTKVIAKRTSAYRQNAPRLKPNGEKHPADVHDAGTAIYYALYQRYGRSCIEMLLRTYDGLAEKTTEAFLAAVSKQSLEVADKLRQYI